MDSVLAAARTRLRAARVVTPALDAEVLLGHALGVPREHLRAHSDDLLSRKQRRRYARLVSRRASHVPVAYLTGTREFFGLPIRVTPRVLIPRPETEILVERAIRFLRSHPDFRLVVDLGTGSGAVAVALARALPHIRVRAVDSDRAALTVARQNARALGVAARVRCSQGDLLNGIRAADVLVANLPYLSARKRRSLPEDVRYEPVAALDGGPDGLRLIHRALEQAPAVLRSRGLALFECDPGQARGLRSRARATWPGASVEVIRDLSGRARVVEVQLP